MSVEVLNVSTETIQYFKRNSFILAKPVTVIMMDQRRRVKSMARDPSLLQCLIKPTEG